MKYLPFLVVSIAAFGFEKPCFAANVTVRVTGSNAFRVATSKAIKNILSSGSPQIAYDNGSSAFTLATYQTFIGTLPGVTGNVTVKTNWSGSVAGIRDVAQANLIKFLPDGVNTFTGNGTAVPPPTGSQIEYPDIAMADHTQASTPFKSPNIQTISKVGIVPFALVAGKDTSPSVANLTEQGFSSLFSVGSQPTFLFTGNLIETQPIYATGSDPFSGTRLVAMAETGFATAGIITQFKVINFTAGNTVGQINIWPANPPTVPDAGNDGESSEGRLAKILRYTTNNVNDLFNGYTGPASFITYLSATDSYNAVFGLGNTLIGSDQGNGRYLTFNGVAGFGGRAKNPSTVQITSGSNVVQLVTGVANDTSGLISGQGIVGSGINPGSRIVAINTALNRVTLDKNSLATNAALTGCQIGSLLPAQIRNGAYTFWNYEYMLWKTGFPGPNIVGTSGDKFTVASAIRSRITNIDYAASGLADDVAMRVQRDGDGAVVYPK